MYKLKFNLIIFSILLVYTQGLWERLFIVDNVIKYFIDFVLLLAVFFKFKYSFKVPGSKAFLWFLFISMFVVIGNSSSLVDMFLYIRYIVFSYLIFNQMYNSRLTNKQFAILLKTIYFCIVIQGIAAAFNLFVLGIRVEGYVGIMSSLGGTTATSFPVLIVAISTLFFLYNKSLNKKQLISLVLFLMSAVLVAFSSGKRGVYILVPLIVLITVFLARKRLKRKKVRQLVLVSILMLPVFFYGVINSKGFSYNLTGNESYSEIVAKMNDYSKEYESATDVRGSSIGRTNTTINALEASFVDAGSVIVGYGFGKIKDKFFLSSISIFYGIVGFSNTLISGGWIFSFVFCWLMLVTILKTKTKKDPISYSFFKVIAIIFLIIHFVYSSDFIVSLKLTFIIMPLLAIFKSPKYLDYKYQLYKSLNIIS